MISVPGCASFRSIVICATLLGGCATDHARPPLPEATSDAAVPGELAAASEQDAAASAETFALRKGPAHNARLPAPNEHTRYRDGDEVWRYIAPDHAERVYDAAYFDGRYFVLHGKVVHSEKVVLSEINWLSSSRDGLQWETIVVTEQPYESYIRLASNGKSLLLAGSRHVGRLVGGHVEPIEALEQSWSPAVIVPYPDGYAIGRKDDILWMGVDGSVERVLEHELAQLRVGVARGLGARSVVIGPFGAFASTDGRSWTTEAAPCIGCITVGIAYGNERYLAAGVETLYGSDDGASWSATAWQALAGPTRAPAEDAAEERLTSIDFTGGYFVALLADNDTRLSPDGVTFSEPLKIEPGPGSPAACEGRCFIANGRILRAPAVLDMSEPLPGADASTP